MSRKLYLPVLLLAVLLAFGFNGPAQATYTEQCPPDVDGLDTDRDGVVDNDNVCLHIAAGDGFTYMADGRFMYSFGFKDVTGAVTMGGLEMINMAGMFQATFPSSSIRLREGQRLYLNLHNVGMMKRPDLFDAHSVHWHGERDAAPVFDGVPDSSISINMGHTMTYFYLVDEPGTYVYHCHVEATEHMQMGMLGQLYVEPIQNMLEDGTPLGAFVHQAGNKYAYNDGDGSTYYDKDYLVQLSAFDPNFHEANFNVDPLPFALMEDTYPMINGRGYPDTVDTGPKINTFDGRTYDTQPMNALIEATAGEKILLRLSCLSTSDFYTISSPGIPMTVVGRGAKILRGPGGADLYFTTTSVNLGGGEVMDVILDTAGIAPGTYYFYTTNLNYLSNDNEDFGGMMTEIRIQ